MAELKEVYDYDEKVTLGESYVEQYLIDNEFAYEPEVDINDLKGDYDKSHRRADFYLKRYDVFVEFLGEWNNPYKREQYNKKKWVFKQNNKACIYIYPDNLGFLDYVFRYRLKEVLKNFKRKGKLRRYYSLLFLNKVSNTLGLLAVLLALWYVYFIDMEEYLFSLSLVIFLIILVRLGYLIYELVSKKRF